MAMKPSAKGVNHFFSSTRQCASGALARADFEVARRSSQGTRNSTCTKRNAVMPTTKMKNSCQRASSTSTFCMLCTVVNAIIGRNSAAASRPVIAASFSARMTGAWDTRAGATDVMSDLLDVRPAQDALRHEDQGDGENRENRDVL